MSERSDIDVIHTIASISHLSGGTSRVVRDLTDSLSVIEDCSVRLVSQCRLPEDSVEVHPNSEVTQEIAFPSSQLSLRTGISFRSTLIDSVLKKLPSLIHDHGMWMPSNHFVATVARKAKVPLVLNTHGMLEPWAINHHGLRKKVALKLYEMRDLRSVSLFFATSEQEVESIRRIGLSQPIAMVPNGLEFPDGNTLDGRSKLKGRERILLYLGRIHPIKGLLRLIQVWANLQPQGWRLILAGPDDGGHLNEVLLLVRHLGLDRSVDYLGVVRGAEKARVLQSADLLVLPSFSENFGVVVGEALTYGLPVITTQGTPWKGLVDNRCGWWVEAQSEAIERALREAISLGDRERSEMGARGRKYASSFDQRQVADQILSVYRWLVSDGEKPGCVQSK